MRTLDELEAERRRRQARLDLEMGSAERNRAGQFATPSALADEIVQFCRRLCEGRPGPLRFLEPCAGTGSFYSSLCRVFPPDRIRGAAAYEIDPRHAEAARELWQGAGLTVNQADFTEQPAPLEKYDLLITNPPYVRHHHLDRPRKERLRNLVRERLGVHLSGLAGLYCYFLLLSHAWLKESGLSAWLIPSEFMDVNYGAAVKEYLTTRVKLLHIHRFRPADVKFADALVSSAVVIFQTSPPSNHAVTFSLGGSLLHPEKTITLPHGDLLPADKWTGYVARGAAVVRPEKATLFGDIFTIKRGLATGRNDFFILPRAKAQALGLPAECLRPILPPPRQLLDPVVESDRDGYPLVDPQLALLDCRLPEHAVRELYPDLGRYLRGGQEKHVHEGYLTSRRTPWYSQEDRPPPPFLCTYMGRNGNGRKPFRFIRNKSRATAHNVYLLLYPKGLLKGALERDATLYERVFAALQSLDTDGITGEGRVYGGGLFKMEPKELANIPADFLRFALGPQETRHTLRQRAFFDS